MKKLYQVLIILDDLADMPQLHKPNGALDTLFIRGRRMQISTWVSSQKLRLIRAALPVVRAGDAGTLQLPLRVLSEAEE